MEYTRRVPGDRPPKERVKDWDEFHLPLAVKDLQNQGARCMDCGVPFCHWACTVASKIPEWQDALYRGNYKEAYEILTESNAFPEFTGRICPALCEKSCVLNIHNESVTIRENECSVAEKAFAAKAPVAELLGQLALLDGVEGVVDVQQLFGLGLNRPDHPGVAVADAADGTAGEHVEDFVTVEVKEGVVFAVGNDPRQAPVIGDDVLVKH